MFYTIKEGNIENPDNLVLLAKHVFIKDIGTSAYTSFEENDVLIDFYDDVPESFDMRRGLIHTHHNMSTSFSSTDYDEIKDNSDKYDFYLSLIVNFDGKYSAKIATVVETEPTYAYVKTGDGNTKKIKISEGEKIIVLYNCNIIFDVPDYALKYYNKIKTQKTQEKKQFNNTYQQNYKNLIDFYSKETKSIKPSFIETNTAIIDWLSLSSKDLNTSTLSSTLFSLSQEYVAQEDIEQYLEILDESLETYLSLHFNDNTLDFCISFLEDALEIISKNSIENKFKTELLKHITYMIEYSSITEELENEHKQLQLFGNKYVS